MFYNFVYEFILCGVESCFIQHSFIVVFTVVVVVITVAIGVGLSWLVACLFVCSFEWLNDGRIGSH